MKTTLDMRGGAWLAAAVMLAACGDGTGVQGPETVSLNFRVDGPTVPAAAAGMGLVAGPPMTIEGTNGSLTIDEIRIVINEVQLKPEDDNCEDGSLDDSCGEFEAPPRFLDLPLDGEPIAAVTALIAPGTYEELDFEIEDLEDDETDPAQAAAIDAVRTQILSEISDWPRKASALVAGSFAATGGGSIDFRVFLDAEIEIEMELFPRLVIGDDGTASRDLTVNVRPEMWFLRPDGTVLPLHLYDYDLTRRLLDFELEMEDGFTELEIG